MRKQLVCFILIAILCTVVGFSVKGYTSNQRNFCQMICGQHPYGSPEYDDCMYECMN